MEKFYIQKFGRKVFIIVLVIIIPIAILGGLLLTPDLFYLLLFVPLFILGIILMLINVIIVSDSIITIKFMLRKRVISTSELKEIVLTTSNNIPYIILCFYDVSNAPKNLYFYQYYRYCKNNNRKIKLKFAEFDRGLLASLLIRFNGVLTDSLGLFYNSKAIIKQDMINHYDLLIKENHDPVFDNDKMREYMNKYDGQAFIEQMELSNKKTVLEIGVGSGRVALKVIGEVNKFVGVDISNNQIEQAKKNLYQYNNKSLICDDFIACYFNEKFDVIYSMLTFSHIENKIEVFNRIKQLLNDDGRFILSIIKNENHAFKYNDRIIYLYPSMIEDIIKYCELARLTIINQFDTELAHIFVMTK